MQNIVGSPRNRSPVGSFNQGSLLVNPTLGPNPPILLNPNGVQLSPQSIQTVQKSVILQPQQEVVYTTQPQYQTVLVQSPQKRVLSPAKQIVVDNSHIVLNEVERWKNLYNQLQVKSHNDEQKIISLQTQVSTLLNGRRDIESLQATLMERDRRINDLERMLHEREQHEKVKKSKKNNEILALQGRINDLEDQIRSLQKALDDKTRENSRLYERNDYLEAQSNRDDLRIKELIAEISELRTKIVDVTSYENEIFRLNQEIMHLSEELAPYQNLKNTITHEIRKTEDQAIKRKSVVSLLSSTNGTSPNRKSTFNY